jgi:hypothetical protein
VWVAGDGGGHRHRLGEGTSPVIAEDGSRVAWRTFGRRDSVRIARPDGKGSRRLVRGRDIGDVAVSADGTRVAVALRSRVVVYDAGTRREVASVRGHGRGLSFSPDGQGLALGLARDAATGASDLWTLAPATGARTRLTTDGRALNPVWGPQEIVFDRAYPRRHDATVYQLRGIRPDGTGRRAITHLRVPSLLSGLVPLDLSADGRRLAADFVGQDTAVGFAVNARTGRYRSLSRDQETGFVAADISADGRTILGSTGGPDVSARHDVVTRPFGGGRATVLVRDAGSPDWSR